MKMNFIKNVLPLMSIEADVILKLDFDVIIKEFSRKKKKTRKRHM